MNVKKINLSYSIDQTLYENLISCGCVVFWGILVSNEIDGFTIFKDFQPIKFFNEKRMLCIKKSGNVFLYISYENFEEIVEEYFLSDIYAVTHMIQVMSNLMSYSDMESDSFWSFYSFMKDRSKKRVFIPL